MPTFVIEGVDKRSLMTMDPEKNGDKYDHFERMKPDDVYRHRIQSGPIGDFQKTKTTEASWVDSELTWSSNSRNLGFDHHRVTNNIADYNIADDIEEVETGVQLLTSYLPEL